MEAEVIEYIPKTWRENMSASVRAAFEGAPGVFGSLSVRESEPAARINSLWLTHGCVSWSGALLNPLRQQPQSLRSFAAAPSLAVASR